MRDWISGHQHLLWWMGLASAAVAVASVLAVPVLVARLPVDYLTNRSGEAEFWPSAHPFVRWPARIGKNVFGALLILCGIAMLVLPGQGVLTIAAGMMLMDFPGRRNLVRWIIGRPPVLRAINWLRRREKRPPLERAVRVAVPLAQEFESRN